MSTTVMIAKDVEKTFGETKVLRKVSLTVDAGEVVCILGPSGSGKSTFLKCINHLEVPDGGRILVDGADVGFRFDNGRLFAQKESEVARKRERIGMVFQQFNLFPHLTALENVTAAPMWVSKRQRHEVENEALILLDRVGVADKAGAYPPTLSGGQQQRVAIARALAMKPSLLLFDEPTSALDPEMVGEVLDVMKDLARGGTTMIIVTHEIGFARDVADRIVFMSDGEVLEEGPPGQVLGNPRHPRTASFVGSIR